MTSGHDSDPSRLIRGTEQADPNWAKVFLAEPLVHDPGAHFIYNTLATYMLSAIVQRLTGQRILHYLGPRLFEPLGIAQPTWQTSPQGVDTGGWGLSVTTPDIARFGHLYLQRGMWQGKHLLAEDWVAQATSRQVPNGPSENPDWEQGYGFQFWRCRHGVYRGDGMFGQFCIVMPDQEAVLAITAGVMNMQAVLDLVWAHLLPAMAPGALPADPAAEKALAARFASDAGAADAASPLAAELSGREFALDDNSEGLAAIAFAFADGGGAITIRDGHEVRQHAPFGYGRWITGETGLLGPRGGPILGTGSAQVGACGVWKDDRTLVVQLCWPETPFRLTLTCRFEGDRLAVDQEMNVSFDPAGLPRLEGRAVSS